MKLKRTVSAMLLACLLVGCGSTADVDDSGDARESTTEQDTTSAEVDIVRGVVLDTPDIETADYEGREFNVLYYSGGHNRAHELFLFAEDDGDVMNEAIYKRNSSVEEALNIKINGITNGDIDSIYKTVQKAVMGGDSTYDLALTHCVSGVPNLVAERLVYDWYTVPNVDLTKNYWDQNAINSLEVNGVLPLAVSSYNPPDFFIMLFNKKIQDNYGLDDYYSLVRDGKWTIDKFYADASSVSVDLNSDSVYDVNDLYGFAAMFDCGFQGFAIGSGCSSTQRTEDGFVFCEPSERLVNAYQKLYSILYDGHNSFTFTQIESNNKSEKAEIFQRGHALFYCESSFNLDLLRSMDTDFGILPYPKYDEEQEKYYTLNMSGHIIIPKSVSDIDLVGKAAELLSYYSEKYFVPAYYDILLGSKYSRDDESAEMLDIIFNNMVMDCGMTYGDFNALTFSFLEMARAKTDNVSSFYSARIKSIQLTFDKKIDIIRNYND